jgi:type III pantothenate kinase
MVNCGFNSAEALTPTRRQTSSASFSEACCAKTIWIPRSSTRLRSARSCRKCSYSLRSCCRKYFAVDPFILQAGARTGLKILYRNPAEVGPDRIANAIGAVSLYPNDNLIVIDFGTATTINVISAKREYLGGAILPGLRIAMEALEKNTARLPTVEIVPPHDIIGRSTIESIQSGLYFGTRAMVLGLTRELRKAAFGTESTIVIGTGGFARLFEREKMFDTLVPDLVLLGLQRALEMNEDGSRRWTRQDAERDR